MKRLLLVFLVCVGCPKPAAAPPGPWQKAKADTYASGGLHIYVRGAARDPDRGLPGLAFGDLRGPGFGLLGGYYAPQLLAPRSAVAHTTGATLADDRLDVSVGDLEATFLVPKDGRAKALIDGSFLVVAPADRTTFRTFADGKPAFAKQITAGGKPGVRFVRADVVEIEAAEGDTWRIETPCPRVRLLVPRPTGSTSTFVVAFGPGDVLTDEIYVPPSIETDHPDLAQCDKTATSTFTFAWPRSGR